MSGHDDAWDGRAAEDEGSHLMTTNLAVQDGDSLMQPAEYEPQATSLMEVIANASRDPNVDVDKLQRLIELADAREAREAERTFHAAMRSAQAEMRPVTRDAKNDQTRSRYATLEAVSAAINPIIAKHGFSTSYDTDASPIEGHYRVKMTVAHEAGHSREYHADIPIDAAGLKGQTNKTATHAFGSTMSYGRRYLKMLAFDIATTDDDDGNAAGRRPPADNRGDDRPPPPEETGELISEQDSFDLDNLLTDLGDDVRRRFLDAFGIKHHSDLPAARFAAAWKKLQVTRQARKKEPAQ